MKTIKIDIVYSVGDKEFERTIDLLLEIPNVCKHDMKIIRRDIVASICSNVREDIVRYVEQN